MARLAIAFAGAAVGSAFGQPGIGFAVGSALGNHFFAPPLPDVVGPRLGDLTVSTSREGADMPIVWGTVRLSGNIFWAEKVKEHEHEEEYGGGKGGPSGTEYTYTYTGTFAISLGKFASTHIRRIWANKKLIYDATGDDGQSTRVIAGAGVNFNLYLGSSTQTADSRIVSDVGSGNSPGYRDQTYLLFRDLPLADYGNAIPSIEVEITAEGIETHPDEIITLNDGGLNCVDTQYDPGTGLVWQLYNNNIADADSLSHLVAIDPYTRTVVRSYTDFDSGYYPTKMLLFPDDISVSNSYIDRIYLVIAHSGANLMRVLDAESFAVLEGDTSLGSIASSSELDMGTHIWREGPGTRQNDLISRQDYSITTVDNTLDPWLTQGKVLHRSDAKALAVLKNNSTDAIGLAWFYPLEDGGNWSSVTTLSSTYEIPFSDIIYDPINSYYWFLASVTATSDIVLIAVDEILDIQQALVFDTEMPEDSITWGFQDVKPIMYYEPISRSIWFNSVTGEAYQGRVFRLDLIDLEFEYWNHDVIDNIGIYHAETDTFISYITDQTNPDGGGPVFFRVKAIGNDEVNVSDIITDVCDLAGVGASNIDVTEITETTIGYVGSRRAPARRVLEPLLATYFIDSVQSDYKLKFVPRSRSVVATIRADDLAAHADGDTIPDSVSHWIPQAVDIPKSLDFAYISYESSQQPAVTRAQWVTGTSERSASNSVLIVLNDEEAAQIADIQLMDMHNVEAFDFTLSRKWAKLEPTDIVNLPVGSEAYEVMLTEVDDGVNGIRRIKGLLYDSSAQTSYAESGGALTSSDIIASAKPIPVLLDCGLLRDVDIDHPGPYFTAFTYSTGFPACGVYMSTDGSSFQSINSIINEPDIGHCATTSAVTDFEDWDDSTTLSVDMVQGTLASLSNDAVIAGGNAALWGRQGRWELVQFGTVSLVSGSNWNVSHLLRGRRGTDWAMTLHAEGDYFIIVNTQDIVRTVLTNADIGSSRYYKFPVIITPVSDALTLPMTVGDAPLMPYSASNPTASYSSGTGWTFGWTRRTRRGGQYGGPSTLTDGVGGPIEEDSEEYEIDIAYQADPDTVVRAYTSISSNSKVYSDADMASDGVNQFDDIQYEVYQISAVVDRGYVRLLEVDGIGIEMTVTNPGAESGPTGSVPTGWENDSATYANSVPIANFNLPHIGSYSFDMDVSGSGTNQISALYQNIDIVAGGIDTVDIDAGTATCYISAWVFRNHANTGFQFSLGFVFRDSGGSVISSDHSAFAGAPDPYAKNHHIASVPVNTRTIDIYLRGSTAAVPAGSTFIRFDDVVFKVDGG